MVSTGIARFEDGTNWWPVLRLRITVSKVILASPPRKSVELFQSAAATSRRSVNVFSWHGGFFEILAHSRWRIVNGLVGLGWLGSRTTSCDCYYKNNFRRDFGGARTDSNRWTSRARQFCHATCNPASRTVRYVSRKNFSTSLVLHHGYNTLYKKHCTTVRTTG